jgi:hypothetical protein
MSFEGAQNWWRTAGKLALCGASIVAIAWAMLWIDARGGIDDVSASIVSLEPVPRSGDERFREALDHLGHSAPRTFDYNGNEVHFSSRTTRKSPREVLLDYQRTFVQRGINETLYRRPLGSYLSALSSRETTGELDPSIVEGYEAMMSGQMVPIDLTADYASLGGGFVKGRPRTRSQAETVFERHGRGTDFAELFEGYRFIEAFRRDDSNRTAVTAVWSGESFEVERQFPELASSRGSSPGEETRGDDSEPAIPPCSSCRRALQFDGRGADRPYAVDAYVSARPVEQVAAQYDRLMRRRGWRRTDVNRMLERIAPHAPFDGGDRPVIQYRRGETVVTLEFQSRSSRGTAVTAFRSN